MQTWAQQHSKPHWNALTNAPYIETGPGPFGAMPPERQFLLSDNQSTARSIGYLDVERHIGILGMCRKRSGRSLSPLPNFSLTNMLLCSTGAVVRQSTVTPAAPDRRYDYNVGSEPKLP